MSAQFIFHTYNCRKLRVSAFLGNTSRNGEHDYTHNSMSDIQVALAEFHNGKLIFKKEGFCTISPGKYFEISEENCPLIAPDDKDYTLVAYCNRQQDKKYFPQEHQLTISRQGSPISTSLIYDQMPTSSKSKSIILLAPKVWISNDVNTIISFANSSYLNEDLKETSWEFSFITGSGRIIHTLRKNLKQNNTFLLNIKEALFGIVKLTDKLEMINVVARGESSACVILTLLQNEKTGAIALEHSLSPHYYMNGDFDKVRKEAFLFLD